MDQKEKERFNLSLSDEGIVKTPREKPVQKNAYSLWFYLGSFGNIGLTIALPIVLGAIGGSLLDSKQGSKPLFTICGISIGLIISIAGFVQLIRRILRGDYTPR